MITRCVSKNKKQIPPEENNELCSALINRFSTSFVAQKKTSLYPNMPAGFYTCSRNFFGVCHMFF